MENKDQANINAKPETLDMQYARSAFLTGEYGHLALGEMTDVIKSYNCGFHDAVRIREIDDRHNNVDKVTADAKCWNLHIARMYNGYLAEMKSRGEEPEVPLEEFAERVAYQVEHTPPPKIESRNQEDSSKSAELHLPERLHDDTKDLVVRFSQALGEKLYRAEAKYGYSNGWMEDDWMDKCRGDLLQHVLKGDPIDVAAYCAFLWFHDEPTIKYKDDSNSNSAGFSGSMSKTYREEKLYKALTLLIDMHKLSIFIEPPATKE